MVSFPHPAAQQSRCLSNTIEPHVGDSMESSFGNAGNGYPMICRGSTGGAPCNININQVMSSQWLNGLSYCDAAGFERQRERVRKMYRE